MDGHSRTYLKNCNARESSYLIHVPSGKPPTSPPPRSPQSTPPPHPRQQPSCLCEVSERSGNIATQNTEDTQKSESVAQPFSRSLQVGCTRVHPTTAWRKCILRKNLLSLPAGQYCTVVAKKQKKVDHLVRLPFPEASTAEKKVTTFHIYLCQHLPLPVQRYIPLRQKKGPRDLVRSPCPLQIPLQYQESKCFVYTYVYIYIVACVQQYCSVVAKTKKSG